MADIAVSSIGKDAELQRVIADVLKKIPRQQLKSLDSAYTEPINLTLDHKPTGIVLVSCVSTFDPEAPEDVLSGGFVHWTWEGAKSRARINSIDGLTPAAAPVFRFNFWVVG